MLSVMGVPRVLRAAVAALVVAGVAFGVALPAQAAARIAPVDDASGPGDAGFQYGFVRGPDGYLPSTDGDGLPDTGNIAALVVTDSGGDPGESFRSRRGTATWSEVRVGDFVSLGWGPELVRVISIEPKQLAGRSLLLVNVEDAPNARPYWDVYSLDRPVDIKFRAAEVCQVPRLTDWC